MAIMVKYIVLTAISNKLSLDDTIRIAKFFEGKCLSEKYINSKTLML